MTLCCLLIPCQGPRQPNFSCITMLKLGREPSCGQAAALVPVNYSPGVRGKLLGGGDTVWGLGCDPLLVVLTFPELWTKVIKCCSTLTPATHSMPDFLHPVSGFCGTFSGKLFPLAHRFYTPPVQYSATHSRTVENLKTKFHSSSFNGHSNPRWISHQVLFNFDCSKFYCKTFYNYWLQDNINFRLYWFYA